jgi:predicted transcriptional regulator
MISNYGIKMTFQSENDIVVKILELFKVGSTMMKLKNDLAISHVQLRKTLAELVDMRFLEYIEPKQLYITTDKGIKFLNMKRYP